VDERKPLPSSAYSVPSSQGLTLVLFSTQPKPFWSHLPVSPCLIEWGEFMHPTLSYKMCLR